MKSTLALSKNTIKTKTLAVLAAIAAAVALPQVFHYLGVLSGFGPMPGATFLPMHIPVLIAGFMAGPAAGLIAGALSPVFSFVFTSAAFDTPMPALIILPFMVIELAGYGFIAGLLCKSKKPVLLNLMIAQAAGRALRALAVLIAVFIFGLNNPPTAVSTIWTTITIGLPGILLQWALIPLFIHRFKKS
ncbi:MAG: ECF transporter S component [Oscillospiraceae bacterium]|nr:ECF transporter S component [Oscillospiraceae bacterium]